jgi:antirepressor protein
MQADTGNTMSTEITAIDFHGDTIWAVKIGGKDHVALKPISDSLGLDWSAQLKRLKRDAVMSEGMAMMAMLGGQETVCLRFDLLNGWLFGVDDTRIKLEVVRQKVLAYKRECYSVLFDHFHVKAKAAIGASAEPADERSLPWSEKRMIWLGVLKMSGPRAALKTYAYLGFKTQPEMFHQSDQRDLFGDLDASVASAAGFAN